MRTALELGGETTKVGKGRAIPYAPSTTYYVLRGKVERRRIFGYVGIEAPNPRNNGAWV